MPQKTSTIQGQAWDQIAKDRLGGEYAMHELLKANWQARGVLLFSGDIPLTVPDLPETQKKAATQSLPPWKR